MTLLRSVVGWRAYGGALASRTRAAARGRFVTVLATVGAAVGFAAAAGMSVPVASACDNSTHCHGLAYTQDSSGYSGVYGQVRTNCINLANANEFVTNEMWAVTSNGQRWVEVGQGRGAQLGTATLQYFWGRNDPTLSPAFRSVNLGGAPNNSYNEAMLQLSGGEWWVWNAGVWNHTSALTTNVSTLEAGAETNSNNTSSWGSVYGMQAAPPGGGWILGFPGAGFIRDTNTQIQWVTSPYWIQMGAGNITC